MGSISIPNSPSSDNGRPGTSDTQGTGFSTTSTMKRKKKKEQPVYSLEDLFGQISTANTSNLNAPAGKVVLTPRSAEVHRYEFESVKSIYIDFHKCVCMYM